MTDKEIVAELVAAMARDGSRRLLEMGIEIGKLYTDYGLPIDMSFSELEKREQHSKQDKLLMLHGACQWFIEHRRNSGATEKSIERQRQTNRETLRRFLTTDEVGVY